jgi:pimeloyl-ACP methyl ester carboxylesterase
VTLPAHPDESIMEIPNMTLETAPTRFLDAAGVRFSFRRLGPAEGTPLVCLQHFTGTMDAWDPAVVNALAATRPVIVFNNAGVGRSSGTTPDNVERMAADAEAFIRELGLRQVDLLGFSLGGFVAQVLASRSPALVRRLILVGTAPRGGEEHLLAVLQDAFARKGGSDVRLPLFFTASEASQAAGRAFVARAGVRVEDRDPDSTNAVSEPQAKALIGWCAAGDDDATLKAITHPALIVSGSDDTMLPNRNAIRMYTTMPNAQLILYPDSGHGALFQYPDPFVAHCVLFLNG